MSNSAILSDIFDAFDEIEPIGGKYDPEGLGRMRRVVAEKRKTPSASIMIYGVYNAGKSTLINALLGEQDRAKVGDAPETAKVTSYRWREFEILDTPGIDAPHEHEQVTRTQLHSADIVIFVLNPLGVAEEEKTLSVLTELLERGKKVLIVLNCKNRLEPEDAFRLKEQIRKSLQDLASRRGLRGEFLQNIPILEINAKSALKAKVEKKQALLASSGVVRLEEELHKFLTSPENQEVWRSLAHELEQWLAHMLASLDAEGRSDALRRIDDFSAKMANRQAELREGLKLSVDVKASFIEKGVLKLLNSASGDVGAAAKRLVDACSDEIIAPFNDESRRLHADATFLIGEMMKENERAAPDLDVSLARIPGGDEAAHGDFSGGGGVDYGELLEKSATQLAPLVNTGSVVSLLKLGKHYAPTLFKGIGPVTMGKIGEQVVGKFVPLIGAAYQLYSSLMREDPEEKLLREKIRLQEQQEERRKAAIQEAAQNVAWDFKAAILKATDDAIDEDFGAIREKIREIRSDLSGLQRERSEDRMHLTEKHIFLRNLL